MALDIHPWRKCSSLLLISQLSRLKQCGLCTLLKDTTYWYSRGLNRRSQYLETDFLLILPICHHIRQSSYYEWTRLNYSSSMPLRTASTGIYSRFQTNTATATLVSVFVLSRIEFCRSLLIGSTHNAISRLQWIQNIAAHVILRNPKSSNITTSLKSHHWLTNTCKIACLYCHWYNNTTPSYVTDMQQKMPPHSRKTHSSTHTMPLLRGTAHSNLTFGDPSFSLASPVWNWITNDIRCSPSL